MRTFQSESGLKAGSACSVSGTGSAFPALPFTCTVHSVFQGALNLRVAGSPWLCSVVASPSKAHPLAAVLGDRTDFLSWGLEAGTRGAFSGSRLEFQASPSVPGMDFSLAEIKTAERICALEVRGPSLQACLHRAETLLESFQAKAGTGLRFSALSGNGAPANPFEKIFLPAAAALVRAQMMATTTAKVTTTGGLDVESAVRLLRPLIGLGEGLTPTGDDFVTGYLAALRARTAAAGDGAPEASAGNRNRDLGTLAFVETLGSALLLPASPLSKSVLSATNDISAAFLACAAKGLFSSALVSFAQALAWSATQPAIRNRNDYGRMDSALEDVCKLGHSSGMDVVSGFLFGLRSCREPCGE